MQQVELSHGAAPAMPTLADVKSKSQYAKHRGVSPAYISKLIKIGKLTAPALRVDGKINCHLADMQIDAQSDPVRMSRPLVQAFEQDEDERANLFLGSSFATEKAAHESLKRQRLELELAKTKGDLVEKAAVERDAEQIARELRDRLLEIPDDLSERMADETNAHNISMMLREAITRCLTQASKDIEAGSFPQNEPEQETEADDD